MKMLIMMCGKTFSDDISNETIREMTIVEKIEGFLSEQRLQRFGRKEKMDDQRSSVKAKSFVVNGSKRSRFKKRFKLGYRKKKEFLAKGLKRSDAQDRTVWNLECKNRSTPACRENKLGS